MSVHLKVESTKLYTCAQEVNLNSDHLSWDFFYVRVSAMHNRKIF